MFAGAPSANFAGIAPTSTGSALSWLSTSTAIPALRTGTHHVTVTATPTKVSVAIDGVTYLNQAV
ncbi:hypothetical protein ABTN76_20880, partial [Acinetobacter baumannii]